LQIHRPLVLDFSLRTVIKSPNCSVMAGRRKTWSSTCRRAGEVFLLALCPSGLLNRRPLSPFSASQPAQLVKTILSIADGARLTTVDPK
jgi:hypothetical protein